MLLVGAETAAASAAIFLAAAIAIAYLVDSVGLRIVPTVVFVTAAAVAAFAFMRLRHIARPDRAAAAIAAVIVAVTFGWLLWLARPDLLPTGSGPDLVHHLALIAYIEQHWHLPHDPQLGAYLGEMVHYTPGVHLLASLAGGWLRTDGLHALDAMLALSVALKAAFVFLVARRCMPSERTRDPFSVGAVVLLLVPYAYSVGSFTEQSYLAQAASELFAVAMWWALTVWDQQPSHAAAVLFAIFGVGAFLTWPVWTGPLLVVFVTVVVIHAASGRSRRAPDAPTAEPPRPLGATAADLLIGVAPVAAIGALHGSQHPAGFLIVRTGGFVIWPTPDVVKWWFFALAAIGVLFALTRRRLLGVTLLLVAIATQAAALTDAARSAGAAAPYLALKMFYLAIYPMAVAIAAMAAALWDIITAHVAGLRSPAAAWIVVAAIGIAVARPVAVAPRPKPVLSEPVFQAGEWAKSHVGLTCVDYLTRDGYTAYWLHLAVFGQPRASGRAIEDETFEPKKALVRWILPGGLPYAITDDLDALPRDIRSNVDVVTQFGRAAVVKRRGTSGPCH